MFSPFPEGSRVIFYGDSITRLGGGVLRVAAQYRALFPKRDVRFVNAGISGGGLPDAAFYFDGWIAPFMPTHVVLAFGVNDANAIARGRLEEPEAESARRGGACDVPRALRGANRTCGGPGCNGHTSSHYPVRQYGSHG